MFTHMWPFIFVAVSSDNNPRVSTLTCEHELRRTATQSTPIMYVQKARMEVIHSVPSAKSESEDEFVRNFQTCKKVFGELGENPSRGPVSDAPRLSLSIISG
ncbi:hypothetical protein K443DRAFT_367383 [Laccaria amethystina LaAM-08-1]|uniref:Uncharacterized protein n=1 Tax=Laccaria amethystina LaAM-08-1 TaxID=1095629 RepID=A0A0C9XJF3_9AGAR|nr:hypothetical protein K443DRAFT_367383 [Laccaria amethystina LaAM-08-1]